MNAELLKHEKRFDLDTYLDQFEYTMSGDNAVLDCPTCDGVKKLYVLTKDKDLQTRRGSWICYKCNDHEGGSGRSCLSLIEWMEDLDFVDAIKRLAEGGTSADSDFVASVEKLMAAFETTDDEEPIPTIALPDEFQLVDPGHVPPYILERGISVERAQRFRLGYCRRGKYKNRLVAPVHFNGACAGFQARWMAAVPPEGVSKTKHAKGAKMSRLLYNYDVARHAERIVLVEDPWSAIKIGRSGVCSFGTSLSASQLELLMRSNAREVTIIYDLDPNAAEGASGYEKSLAIAERLSSVVPTRAVKMPDERDPDEHTLASLRNLIARTPLLTANAAWAARVKRSLARF